MMRWFVAIVTFVFTGSVAATDMSVDQAVSRLLKDIKDVEVMRSRPWNPHHGVPTGKQSLARYYSHRRHPSSSRGETLDMVIRKVAPNSSLQRDLLRKAFVRANPHAFRRNNQTGCMRASCEGA